MFLSHGLNSRVTAQETTKRPSSSVQVLGPVGHSFILHQWSSRGKSCNQVSPKCRCWGISVFSRVELHPKGIFDMELESPSEKWIYWNMLLTYGNLEFVSLHITRILTTNHLFFRIFTYVTIDDSSWDLLSTNPVLKLLSQKGSLLCNNRLQELIT